MLTLVRRFVLAFLAAVVLVGLRARGRWMFDVQATTARCLPTVKQAPVSRTQ